MKAPIFIRPLTEDERQQLKAGRRSSDAFVVRRGPILRALARGRGERVPAIACEQGLDEQTVRKVINCFNTSGLTVLTAVSSRPSACARP